MPITETPPTNQQQGVPKFSVRVPKHVEDQELHFLLEETVEERDRSRVREAKWISIILHMVLLAALYFLPMLLPKKAVIAEDQLKDHHLTYLDVPRDHTLPVPKTQSNVIADKNRLQQTPVPDQEMLRRLQQSQRAGVPGRQMQQQTPQQQSQAQTPQLNSTQNSSGLNIPAQTSQVQQPIEQQQQQQKVPDFKADMSAGRNIQQAARASQHSTGNMGDFGIGQTPHPGLQSAVDILSDTMGVDFDPYLKRVIHDVRNNWYSQIPEEALPPTAVQGKVAIQFAILKDGSVSGLQIVGPSGDHALDRAAQGGITGSNPFPPLPTEFGGQALVLRIYFYYNPKNPNDLR